MNVFVKHYSLPEVDRGEWYRYMGAVEPSAELTALAEKCRREAENCFSGGVCYSEIPVRVEGDFVDLGFWSGESKSLSKLLRDCNRAILFAATVGFEIDRLIAKYNRISPAGAVCLQALGSERVEALCDLFCAELKERMHENGETVTRRFSPGYGDLPLEMQRDVFRALDCPRRVGITLNDSLLMSPSKSVTAIVGIRKDPV